MAWPHLHNSRIRINMKDYSKGTGEKAIDVFYNLSPEEFMNLAEAIRGIRQVSASEKNDGIHRLRSFPRCPSCIDIQVLHRRNKRNPGIDLSSSSAAGMKCSQRQEKSSRQAFERLLSGYTSAFSTGLVQMEKLLAGAKKEKEAATKVREVFQAIKI